MDLLGGSQGLSAPGASLWHLASLRSVGLARLRALLCGALVSVSPAAAQPAPSTLTDDVLGGRSLTVDATHVYWTEVSGAVPDRKVRVKKVPRPGGQATQLSRRGIGNASGPGNIVVRGDHAYVAYIHSGGFGRVMRVPIGSGGQEVLAEENQPFYIALDETHVYFTESNAGTESFSSVHRVPLAGGTVETITSSGNSYGAIAVDDQYVYFSHWVRLSPLGGTQRISRYNKSGGGGVALADRPAGATAMLVTGGFLYWIEGGTLYRMTTAGTGLTALTTDPATVNSLALDVDTLLLAGEDRIGRYALTGAQPGPLVTGLDQPKAVAVRDGQVYWLESGPERVRTVGAAGWAAPEAAFDWTPANPAVGFEVDFRNLTTQFPWGTTWDFDEDGEPDSLAHSPRHVFETPGPKTVMLEACNDFDCDSVTESLHVLTRPQIAVNGPASGEVFDDLIYQASAIGCAPDPTGWSWTSDKPGFLDGGPDELSGATATITASYTYLGRKTLTAVNSACGDTSGQIVVDVTDTSVTGVQFSDLPADGLLVCWAGGSQPVVACTPDLVLPSRPTVVMTHGWQLGDPTIGQLWSGFESSLELGYILVQRRGLVANVIQYVWPDAATLAYGSAARATVAAGAALESKLRALLGPGYSQKMHFIGHSLGTIVNTHAAARLLPGSSIEAAQFTVLDRPDGVGGFDECWHHNMLPFDLFANPLVADNYYADSKFNAIEFGGPADGGEFYNHPELERPSLIGDHVFGESGLGNIDHAGVHQWYRWTVIAGGGTACLGGSFNDPTETSYDPDGKLSDSLDPCTQGWNRSIVDGAVATPGPFGAECKTSVVGSVLDHLRSTAGCTLLPLGGYVCRKLLPPPEPAHLERSVPETEHATAEIEVPLGTNYLRFDYTFTNGAGGDGYAAVFVDDTPVWTVRADSAPQSTPQTTPLLDVGEITAAATLSVALYPGSDPDLEIRVESFRFVTNLDPAQIDAELVTQPATELEGVPSQDYETASDSLDSLAADDFTVPAGVDFWYVGQLVARGGYADGPGPAAALSVSIAADDGGRPGTPICNVDLAPDVDFFDAGGAFTVVLPAPCAVPPGPHWLTVQADMHSALGTWEWSTRSPASGVAAQWQNPSDGQGSGCTDWTDASSCLGFGAARDLAFELLGPAGCESGPTHLVLGQRRVTSDAAFLACRSLLAGDGFEVAGAGTDVAFEAGTWAGIGDGFVVGSGASLTVSLSAD